MRSRGLRYCTLSVTGRIGSRSANAATWCGKILHDLKHKSSKPLFKALDKLLEKPPSDDPAVHQIIREQDAYFRSGAEKWKFAADAPIYTSATVYDDAVFFATNKSTAYCLDAKTGKKKWSLISSPPALPMALHSFPGESSEERRSSVGTAQCPARLSGCPPEGAPVGGAVGLSSWIRIRIPICLLLSRQK